MYEIKSFATQDYILLPTYIVIYAMGQKRTYNQNLNHKYT